MCGGLHYFGVLCDVLRAYLPHITLVVLFFAGLIFSGFGGSKLLIEFTEIKFHGFRGIQRFFLYLAGIIFADFADVKFTSLLKWVDLFSPIL